MNILFVTTEDVSKNSSSNIRNISIIKGLLDLDHKVYLVSRRTKSNDIYSSIINRCTHINLIKNPNENMEMQKKSIGYTLIRNNINKIYQFYLRHFSIYGPYRSIVWKNNINIKDLNIDIIISSSDPKTSHLLARKIIKKYRGNVYWIQYWGDPLHNDMTTTMLLSKFKKIKEKKIISWADKVYYTNPFVATDMKFLFFHLKEKISWIPTPYLNEIQDENEKQDFNFSKQEISIGYFGDYFLKWRNIEPLYQACLNLGIKLLVYGNGDFNFNQGGIEVHARSSLSKIIEVQNTVDILVVIGNQSKNIKKKNKSETSQIPGKLYHYAQTNKRIIFISNNTEIEKYYERYNRFVFSKNNPIDIMSAISKTLSNLPLSYNTLVDSFKCINVAKVLIEDYYLSIN